MEKTVWSLEWHLKTEELDNGCILNGFDNARLEASVAFIAYVWGQSYGIKSKAQSSLPLVTILASEVVVMRFKVKHKVACPSWQYKLLRS